MKEKKQKRSEESSSVVGTMKRAFQWRDFIIGAVVPMVVFYAFHHGGRPLVGALMAAGWGVLVVIASYLFGGKANRFAALLVPFSVIELAVTIVSRSPDLFLATTAINYFLWGGVLLFSNLISHPLMKVFAEATGKLPSEEELVESGRAELFRSLWNVLTGIWGCVYLVAAGVLVLAQVATSVETFLFVRVCLGTPLLGTMFVFTAWFSRRYLKKSS